MPRLRRPDSIRKLRDRHRLVHRPLCRSRSSIDERIRSRVPDADVAVWWRTGVFPVGRIEYRLQGGFAFAACAKCPERVQGWTATEAAQVPENPPVEIATPGPGVWW